MVLSFNKAVDAAIHFYQENNYSKGKIYAFKAASIAIRKHASCLKRNSEENNYWLQTQKSTLSHASFKTLRNAIFLIRSIMSNGKVTTTCFVYSNSRSYLQLNPAFKNDLDACLREYSTIHKITEEYVNQIRKNCSRILFLMQKRGIINSQQISLRSLKDFCIDSNHMGHASKKRNNLCNSEFSIYLRWIEKKYKLSQNLSLMMRYQKVHNIIFIENLKTSIQETIFEYEKNNKNLVSFKNIATSFTQTIFTKGYAYSEQEVSKQFVSDFQLFIEINQLHFSRELIILWTSLVCEKSNKGKIHFFERNLFLFLQFLDEGEISPKRINNVRPRIYHNVSSWSMSYLYEYINERKHEGRANSTLNMDYSAIGRFLYYLDIIKIKTWMNLTADIINDFQIQDLHSTPEGKKAYTVHIRSFIRFLARKGLISNTLEYAFSVKLPQREKIITILDKEQKNSIYDFVINSSTPMEYRIASMLMLGLHMGLRNCDVINLKFSNIDWKKKQIAIIQKKTGESLTLPIPEIVELTLKHYLKLGRPKQASQNPFVFVKHRMPYDHFHSKAVSAQLNRVLCKYNCKRVAGFHTLRRDFATSLLRQSVNFQLITYALGQVSKNAINPYLALNDENLKECALSLDGIKFQGNLYE